MRLDAIVQHLPLAPLITSKEETCRGKRAAQSREPPAVESTPYPLLSENLEVRGAKRGVSRRNVGVALLPGFYCVERVHEHVAAGSAQPSSEHALSVSSPSANAVALLFFLGRYARGDKADALRPLHLGISYYERAANQFRFRRRGELATGYRSRYAEHRRGGRRRPVVAPGPGHSVRARARQLTEGVWPSQSQAPSPRGEEESRIAPPWFMGV